MRNLAVVHCKANRDQHPELMADAGLRNTEIYNYRTVRSGLEHHASMARETFGVLFDKELALVISRSGHDWPKLRTVCCEI